MKKRLNERFADRCIQVAYEKTRGVEPNVYTNLVGFKYVAWAYLVGTKRQKTIIKNNVYEWLQDAKIEA